MNLTLLCHGPSQETIYILMLVVLAIYACGFLTEVALVNKSKESLNPWEKLFAVITVGLILGSVYLAIIAFGIGLTQFVS